MPYVILTIQNHILKVGRPV